jgi:hypothetical protein
LENEKDKFRSTKLKESKKMKRYILLPAIIFLILITGCKKDEDNPASGDTSIVATEEWAAVMDGDSSNHGLHRFDKKSDGSITTTGTHYYNNQGTEVVCPFANGEVTVNDSNVVFTAKGTATNPAAPAGYQSSPFTFSTIGVAKSGQAYGTYTIKFSTFGWPSEINGTFISTKTKGSGITK